MTDTNVVPLTTHVTPDEAMRNVDPVSPDGSEDAIALDFVDAHQHELRYAEGRWLRYDSCRFREDRKFVAHDMIRAHVRESALGRDNESQRRATASSKVVNGVERLARTDPRITVLLDDFDADPFILNTPEEWSQCRDQRLAQAEVVLGDQDRCARHDVMLRQCAEQLADRL